MSMCFKRHGLKNFKYQNTARREYLFTGLEEHKDKVNDFRPWLESLVAKK